MPISISVGLPAKDPCLAAPKSVPPIIKKFILFNLKKLENLINKSIPYRCLAGNLKYNGYLNRKIKVFKYNIFF